MNGMLVCLLASSTIVVSEYDPKIKDRLCEYKCQKQLEESVFTAREYQCPKRLYIDDPDKKD